MIEPLVTEFGECVRMDMVLDDWQSDVARAIGRADAVVTDLSHELQGDLSRNVVWEINRLWQTALGSRSNFVPEDKLLFLARNLDHVKSTNPRPDFVYSSEVASDWIANMPKTARNWESLQGFQIRRYDPTTPDGRSDVASWLRERLAPLVQAVPAPITDRQVVNKAEEALAYADELESKWLRAIADREFAECDELLPDPEDLSELDFPAKVRPLLGDLLSTVSAYQAISIPGYWRLAAVALPESGRLRKLYIDIAGTAWERTDHYRVESFIENAWHEFCTIENVLDAEETSA